MNHVEQISSSSLLHQLLIEPSQRTARHGLLITVLMIVAFNQAFMTLRSGIDLLGHHIIYQAAFLFFTYLITCYFNLYVLLPRYLLTKQYSKYAAYLGLCVFLVVTLQTTEERTVLCALDILDDFYRPPMLFVNILSSSVLVFLCISGGAVTVLLKRWITDNRKVMELEKLHIQSEVEQLKEQVSPHLLFNILNRTGVLVKSQPVEASDMLFKLSQLLRYQLYDCSRPEVLLVSEIKFLNNYLTLEQMHSRLFQFQIRSDKNCFHIPVSPLLFISFVQAAVIRISELKKEAHIGITFDTADRDILFTCLCSLEGIDSGIFSGTDFSKVGKRLELLYSGCYSLTVSDNEIRLKLTV